MKLFSGILCLVFLCAAGVHGQVCDLAELSTAGAGIGSLSQPALVGTTAYVAAGSAGLLRVNVSDPSAVISLGATPTQGQAYDLVFDFFSSQLVVADGTGGVGLYTAFGSAPPVHVNTADVTGTVISVAGNTSQYLAGSLEGTVYTVAVGASGASIQGSLDVGGQVRGIALYLQRAYLALGDGGLAVVDVADRANPTLVTTLDLGGAVLSVARESTALYCGVEGVGLITVRVEGDTLHQVNSLSLPDAPTRIVSWGGRLHMVAPETGVYEADASLGSDVLLLSTLPLDGASGIALAGSVLYVGCQDNGLTAVDGSECASSGVHPTTSFVAASARAVGLENTFWKTDLAICNATGKVASFNLAYLVKDHENLTPANVSLLLQPGQQMLIADLFDELFELEAANGALRITTSHPDVKLTSRTYNAAGLEGTYGQFIPAQRRLDSFAPGVYGALLQLQENAAFRTNLGLVNVTADPVDVTITLHGADGALLGTRNEELLAYEMVQLGRIFNLVGAGTVDSGYALVRVVGGEGSILSYASVVDNGSGDPIFIPAQRLTTNASLEQ